ncbi:MAG: TetR/AcrR family transcriptional regulator [Coriobacteriales bacterium]|jgi:AcrR family transcriptional regulator|nr:TetR/AcrR family transcriptional regulator [Coriobacteriales bacterium]
MKLTILHAFERLLEETAYPDISIDDICGTAYISKPTFYRYFKSKDNIFHWLTRLGFQHGVAEIGRSYSWEEGYLVSLLIAYRYRVFYAAPQSPELFSSLMDVGWNCQSDAIKETLVKYRGIQISEKLSYQIESLARAQCHMARRWAVEGMAIPPATMAEYLASSAPYELHDLLGLEDTHDTHDTRNEQSLVSHLVGHSGSLT